MIGVTQLKFNIEKMVNDAKDGKNGIECGYTNIMVNYWFESVVEDIKSKGLKTYSGKLITYSPNNKVIKFGDIHIYFIMYNPAMQDETDNVHDISEYFEEDKNE